MFINSRGIMKKQEPNIKGLYKINKKDIEKCADIAAQTFIDDESSKFLLDSKLNYKSLYEFYLVIYNAIYNKMYMFSESENIDSFIIITPIKNSELSLWDFILAGGLKLIFSNGLGFVLRSLNYEKNCIKIRKKFVSSDDWYIFQFGVLPIKQGLGLGSKIMKPILNWFDSEKITCYLETQKDVNVDIYNHFGFVLKSIDTLPNKSIKQFAMLRSQA